MCIRDSEGCDWEGIAKAREKNERKGRVVAGGSTITQQLAKNLFLSPSKSYVRKGQEAIIALMLEAFLPKERILELYLNVIEWGNGVVGAETLEFKLDHLDVIGTPMAYNHVPVGWAHALCCPFQWTKQIASHWGGPRNGMAMRWPAGLTTQGQGRSPFHPAIEAFPCSSTPSPKPFWILSRSSAGRRSILYPPCRRRRCSAAVAW